MAGTWSDAEIFLGSRRSLATPQDDRDSQPLWSADGTACLIADAVLFNRAELLNELGQPGLAEAPDSLLLLAAWQRWEASCLDHLIGTFAFAVWTPARREVFAARDHAGEAPLQYFHSSTQFALASSTHSLRALRDLQADLDEQRITDWLILNRPERDATFFRHIKRLPPGHLLRCTPQGLSVRQYWHPSDARQIRFARDEEYAEALRDLLDRATAARLRSRGAIASQLSAGLDSSAVTASAALQLAASGRPLLAYTAVPQPGFTGGATSPLVLADEGPAAAEIAACFPNIVHFQLSGAGLDLMDTLAEFGRAMDEPFVNGVNAMWILAILRHARQQGADVLLQGAYGNATISLNAAQMLPQLFRTGHWLALLEHVRVLRAHGVTSYRQAARQAMGGLYPSFLARGRNRKPPFSLDFSAVHPDLARQGSLLEVASRNMSFDPDLDRERRLTFERFDLAHINAAALSLSGVQLRDPTADKRIWEFTYGIPPEQFIAEGHNRSLIRRAMRGRLPDSVRLRYSRGVQGSDWYLPVRAALPRMRQQLERMEASPAARTFLDLARLKRLVDSFPQAGFDTRAVQDSWYSALTRGIAMGEFLLRHDPALRREPSPSPS